MKAWFRRRWLFVVIGLVVVASGPLWAGYIILYTVYLWNISYSSQITQRIYTTDKFEVFRDLLIVIGTIGTGIGTIAFIVMRRELRKLMKDAKEEQGKTVEEYKNELEKNMNELKKNEEEHKAGFEREINEYTEYILAQAEAFLSFTKWRELETNFLETGTWNPVLLKDTIYWAEEALNREEKLNTQIREEFILNVKNLLAYCLAIRKEESDCNKANEYSQLVYDNRAKFTGSQRHYEETYWWVKFHCADDSTEVGKNDKQQVIVHIKNIISDPTSPQQWRTHLLDKYKRISSHFWS